MTFNEWVDGQTNLEIAEIKDHNEIKGKELQVEYCEEDKTCKVCGESFDVFWNKQINEWVFRSAVIVSVDKDRPAEKVVMHENCYDVLEKQLSVIREYEQRRSYLAGEREVPAPQEEVRDAIENELEAAVVGGQGEVW